MINQFNTSVRNLSKNFPKITKFVTNFPRFKVTISFFSCYHKIEENIFYQTCYTSFKLTPFQWQKDVNGSIIQ